MNAQELAVYFFEGLLQKNVTLSQINSATEYINQLLEKGWKVDLIKKELDDFIQEYPHMKSNVYTVQQIMHNKQLPDNLMENDVFYYHNALRMTSKPVRLVYDKEKKEYIRIEEPFFLKMKTCFNMNDLLEYWYNASEIDPNENTRKQDKGKFKYLLGFYDIDEILFMIDIAQLDRRSRQLRLVKNAFELEKYIEQARESIKAKRSSSKIQGVDRLNYH